MPESCMCRECLSGEGGGRCSDCWCGRLGLGSRLVANRWVACLRLVRWYWCWAPLRRGGFDIVLRSL